jgi:hypothetical protein
MNRAYILSYCLRLFSSLMILTCIALLFVGAWSQSGIKKTGQNLNKQVVEEITGPIVDYEIDSTSMAMQSKERSLRETRSLRYVKRAPVPLGELPPNWEGFAIHNDWKLGLPGLPVSESDVILVGVVAQEHAYLSNDKTAVYSEFLISVKDVLKRSSNNTITENNLLTVEREGGVVRFSSGRLLPYKVISQGMPRIDRSYLFFLKRNESGEDYKIITAYQLKKTRVSPIDEGMQFQAYEGMDKTDFLGDVKKVISNVIPPERER